MSLSAVPVCHRCEMEIVANRGNDAVLREDERTNFEKQVESVVD